MIKGILNFISAKKSKEVFVKEICFLTEILIYDWFSIPLTKAISKYKGITPNIITIIALIVSLIAICFYYLGGNINMIIGSIIFYFSNVLDGTDGKLARKNDVKSEFGAKLDKYSDSFRKILALIVLIYADSSTDIRILIGLVFFHYAVNYVKYDKNENHIKRCHDHGLKSFFEPWDAMYILLVVGPFFNMFVEFLIVTIVLQISKIIFHIYLNNISNNE